MKYPAGTIVAAIDPGPERSALVLWDGQEILKHCKGDNKMIMEVESDLCTNWYRHGVSKIEVLVIEQMKGYGMRVADSVFETCEWAGMFRRQWQIDSGNDVIRIPRKQVCLHICLKTTAGDSDIIRELKNQYGEKYCKVVLRDENEQLVLYKAGPRKGEQKMVNAFNAVYKNIVDDEWQAFALAKTWYDQNVKNWRK